MYFWGVYLIWMLELCVFALFISAILPTRWKRLNKVSLIGIIVVFSIIPGYLKLKYSYDSYSLEYQIANTTQMALLALYICVVFKERAWKKALAFALVLVANVLAASFSQLSSTLTNIPYNMNEWNLATFWMYSVVFVPLCICYALFALVWNKTIKHGYRIKNIIFLIIFPVAQFLISFRAVDHHDKMSFTTDIYGCGSLLIGVFADFVLFYILMNQSEKEYLESKLKEKKQLRALEAVRFEELETKREAMAKFRHDYNNQLTTALLLEEQGNSEMAKEMIRRLRKQVTE